MTVRKSQTPFLEGELESTTFDSRPVDIVDCSTKSVKYTLASSEHSEGMEVEIGSNSTADNTTGGNLCTDQICSLQIHNMNQLNNDLISDGTLKPTEPAAFANVKLSPEDINVALQLENQDLTKMSFLSSNGRNFNSSWKKIVYELPVDERPGVTGALVSLRTFQMQLSWRS